VSWHSVHFTSLTQPSGPMLVNCSLWRMHAAPVIHATLLPTAQGVDPRPFLSASFRFSAIVHLLCLNFCSLVSLCHFFRWKLGASRSALKLQTLARTRTFSHVNTRCLSHSLTPLPSGHFHTSSEIRQRSHFFRVSHQLQCSVLGGRPVLFWHQNERCCNGLAFCHHLRSVNIRIN
jgi:hypothetical protein